MTGFARALLGALTILSLAFGSTVSAGEKGSSSGTLLFEKSERIDSSRGGTKLLTRTLVGRSQAENNDGPFNRAFFRCHMTFVVFTGANKPAKGSGYCSGIGSKGNTWNMLLTGDQTGGKWRFVDGTGRYENIKGSGTWKRTGSVENDAEKYEWQGEWELQN